MSGWGACARVLDLSDGAAAAFDKETEEMSELYEWPAELEQELKLLAVTPMATSRFAGFKREAGVPVRTTVGHPRFWRASQGELEQAPDLAPFGVFRNPALPELDQQRVAYEARCEDHIVRIVRRLAQLAVEHPDETLVLLCYEDVAGKGEACHRRWFADWFQRRFGIEVPELEGVK